MIKAVATKRKIGTGAEMIDVVVTCDACEKHTTFTRYCPRHCSACNCEMTNVAAMIGHGIERRDNRALYFFKGVTKNDCRRGLSSYVQLDEYYAIENWWKL